MLYGIRRLDFAFRVFNQAYRFCHCEEGACARRGNLKRCDLSFRTKFPARRNQPRFTFSQQMFTLRFFMHFLRGFRFFTRRSPELRRNDPLERSSIASSHFGSRRANGSLAANVGARSNTRFERLGALLPCQKRLLVRFSIDGYAEDFDLNALNIRVVSIGLRGKLMNFCNLINQGLESNAPAVFQSERDRSQQERQRKNHRNHEQRSLFLFFSL